MFILGEFPPQDNVPPAAGTPDDSEDAEEEPKPINFPKTHGHAMFVFGMLPFLGDVTRPAPQLDG
jgi:hypothetical protein